MDVPITRQKDPRLALLAVVLNSDEQKPDPNIRLSLAVCTGLNLRDRLGERSYYRGCL